MKKLLGSLIAILTITTSQASMSQSGNEHFGKPIVTVARPKIATRNVQVHVKHKKSKAQRAIPYGMDDNDDDYAQVEDIATGYRRRDLTKIEHEDGISERVRWRLFLARQLALLKFRETKGA